MPHADPVLVFDLDGTVLRVNSFPYWVLFLALGGPRHMSLTQRFGVSRRVLGLLIERKRGRMDHETLLRHMQAVWRQCNDERGDTAKRFEALLLRRVRRNLRPVLQLCADGALDAVLATAAAADYAEGLGRRLGFRHVLATPCGRDPGEPSNTGEHKRERLLVWLRERGWAGRPLIFFNDHLADLPLMREASIVCWYGSRRSLEAAKQAAPDVRFVDCRRLTAGELRATLAHVCQSVTVARLQDHAA